ncbi:hypothetical protein [Shewanella japonica]|uniref:Uncharacterized protein n=1 Tax=Shewanella japonica TaxID=93973 RepID=A0ABN4YT84_9GAMM|nr:hypothetical protein [Shewanella japonica]ARD24117.1 hypothetical protein SJ2017_3888 [Shewanella japonica]
MKSKLFEHFIIVFILALFSVYVCLELSLNVLLIDLYAQPIQQVFGEFSLNAERLELFGRVLSGFGLALCITTFFVNSKRVKTLLPSLADKDDKYVNKQLNWKIRPLVLLVAWALIIPSLRVAVDTAVNITSNEGKLGAVRAIVYKEAYLAEVVSIEGFPELDNIASDPNRKQLMVAMIPSLAYLSTGFNSLIGSNLESMANQFLLSRQEDVFIAEALPRIRQFDRVYEQEFSQYKQASKEYVTAFKRENNYALIEAERVALLKQANTNISDHWKEYSEALLTAGEFRESYATDDESVLRKEFSEFKRRYWDSDCKRDCRDRNRQLFADYINNLKFEDGEPFGIYLAPDEINASKVFKSKYNLLGMFDRGRVNYLHRHYGIPEDMEYEQYLSSTIATQIAISTFKSGIVNVSNDWTFDDHQQLRNAIEAKYKGRAKAIWNEYLASSQFKLPKPRLDRVAFARSDVVKQFASDSLGPFYLSSFTPGISEQNYKKKWLDQQDNISFIKMVTSTAATAAFSPGGSMHKLGKDAVTLAVIPPFSIVASLFAIGGLFLKIGLYLYPRHKGYLSVAIVGGVLAFALPVGASLNSKSAYNQMMANFADTYSTESLLDQGFTMGFGYVMDIENGIHSTYRRLAVIGVVAELLYANTDTQDAATGEIISRENPFRIYDDFAHKQLQFIPKLLGFQEVVSPFDTNITVLKQDLNVGAYMGVRLADNKVKSVSMPNFLEHTNIGVLAEQKYFYKPKVSELATNFISNYDDPIYWFNLSQGSVGKKSVIDKLETNMVSYLNNNEETLALLNSLKSKGHNNLILLELENSKRYRCFMLKSLDAAAISQSISLNTFDYQELPKCKATI